MPLKTNIVSNEELKQIMGETLGFLSNTLSRTLGPYGATTIIQDRMLKHAITKDGYSLLKKIYIEEEEARTILDLVKKISRNLVRRVGDGSTSSIIVANSLYNSLVELMSKHKIPAKDLLDVLEQIANILGTHIKNSATPISADMHELESIASVSTNNDEDYGKLITQIFREVGKFGFVNLELAKGEKTYYDITRGFELPRGYIHECMVNQKDEKTCELHDPLVFMTDGMITESDLPTIANIAGELTASGGHPIVFIAKGYDNAAANFFYLNVKKNQLPFLAIELAMENAKNTQRFRDLAMSLGAKPLLKSDNEVLDNSFDVDRLGKCKKAIATDTFARLIEGGGNQEDIDARIKAIEEEIEEKTRTETIIEFDDDIFNLRKRMASLQNTMAVLYVGGATDDAKETDKFLLEDAIFACRSALRFGYIPGGNLAVPVLLTKPDVLKEIAEIPYFADKPQLHLDAIESLYDGFIQSFIHVLENYYMDADESARVANICVKDEKIFNLKKHAYEPMSETKIINSAETDIEILKSAISIMGLLVTSNQFIKMNTR